MKKKPVTPSPKTHPQLTRGGRRWHRLVRATVLLLVLLICLRLVLWAALPWFLERTLASIGLSGSYEKLHLSLLTGDAELWHLTVSPEGQRKSITHLEYCKADISLWTLLRGRLVIPRLEIDGLDVTVHRTPDGVWTGWDRLSSLFVGSSKETAVPADDIEPTPQSRVNLSVPFELDALRLQHMHVTWMDQAITPVLDTRLDLNLRLSDLGSPRRPTRFELLVTTGDVMDKLTLEGSAQGDAQRISGQVAGALQGVYPKPLQAYLEQIGIQVTTQRLDGGFEGAFEVEVIEEPSSLSNPEDLPPQRLKMHARLGQLVIAADSQEQVALDQLVFKAAISDANGIEIESLQMSNGKLRIDRNEEGTFALAGISVQPAAPSPEPKQTPVQNPITLSTAATAPEPPVLASRPTLAWSVGKVDLKQVSLEWDDRRAPDVAALVLEVESGSIGPVPRIVQGARRIPLQGQLRLPGVIESAELSGHCDLISPNKYVDLKCTLEQVTPKALGSYLSAIGLASEHESAMLSGGLRWSLTRASNGQPTRNSVAITNVKLEDRGQILAALEQLRVEDIAWDGGKRLFSIGRIAVQGDKTTIHWDKAGRPHLWGFGLAEAAPVPTKPPADTNDVAAEPTASDTSSPQLASSPRQRSGFHLKEVTWDVGEITLIDESNANQEKQVHRASLTGTLEHIAFNARQAEDIDDGRVDIRIGVPDLIETIRVTGALTNEPPTSLFDVTVEGTGLALDNMAPYVKHWGIVPHMGTSELRAHVAGRLTPAAEGITFSLALQDCQLADENRAYFSLAALRIDRCELGSGLLKVQAIDVNAPTLSIQRDPNGVPVIAGLAFLPRAPGPKEAETSGGSGAPPALCINRLAVRDAQVAFRDETFEPSLETSLNFGLQIKDINTITWDTPASVEAQWRLPGIWEQASLMGFVQQSPADIALGGNLEVTGIHPELVTRYLPEGSSPMVKQGRLALQTELTLVQDPNGGKRLDTRIRDLDFREANETAAWLRLDQAKVVMQTLDRSALQIVVDELTLTGLEARTEKGSDGRLHVMGMALGNRDEPTPPPVVATKVTPQAPGDPNKVLDQATDKMAAALASEPPALRQSIPDVTVHRIQMGIRRLGYQDFTKAGHPKLALEDLVLENRDTIEVLGDNAATKPPILLDVRGRVTPGIGELGLQVEAAPFAAPSLLKIDYAFSRIQGEPLLVWLPEIASRIDVADLTDGRLDGHVEVAATVARRRATEFDFRQAFGLTLSAKDFRFAHGDANQVWIGLDEMHVEIPKIDIPRQRYHIRSVEFIQPRLRLVQEPNGLRVLNLVLKTPAEEGEESPLRQETTAGTGPVPVTHLKTEPAYQVRLDQVLISGLDFIYLDKTATPPVILPLDSMDLDLRGLVYPIPAQASPIRFNTFMTAGRVPITDQDGAAAERFVFQELTANGHVTPGFNPEGWIKAGLKGFDIRAVSGLAARSGVEIRNGMVDVGVDARIRPSGKVSTTVRVALTDLSLRDSSDGFIKKALALSLPLDNVIRMLQGLDGSIRLSLPFTVDADGVSSHQIRASVVGAAALVIGKAVASSPIKLVAGTGKLVAGLTGAGESDDEEDPVEEEPLLMIYEPGAIALNNALNIQIDILAKRMRKDRRLVVTARHQFGIGDIIVAERLANPSEGDTRELLNQLRYLKGQMERQRVDLASRASAAYAAGDFTQGGELSAALADLDGKLGLLEQALDNLLERFGPGSAHLIRRRTRQAGLSIARARLVALRDALYKTDVVDIENRLQIAQPSYVIPEDTQPGRITLTLSRRTVK